MRILIVDDSLDSRILLEDIVRGAGLGEVVHAASAAEAFERLGVGDTGMPARDIDLVLLDVELPELDGIRVCRRIRHSPRLRHVPIIMVTAHGEEAMLESAFREGAVDYLVKPVRPGELVARVDAALKRKREHDRELEQQLALEFRASHDTLTGVSRRRVLLGSLDSEWRRALRHHTPLSFVMIDVDYFHAYNERYGHPTGDACLRRVAAELDSGLCRAGDLFGRYGGEEFAALLPETDLRGGLALAEQLRARVEALAIPHGASSCAQVVTVSLGVASLVPGAEHRVDELIGAADEALYLAKRAGRNRVTGATLPAPQPQEAHP